MITFSPLERDVIEDPYPYYEILLGEHPVHHNAQLDLWTLVRFADVQNAARDWGTFASGHGVVLDDSLAAVAESNAGNILQLDPPAHDLVRKVVQRQFTPRTINGLRDAIAATVDAHVTQLLASTSVDLARDYAWRIPTAVMASLLGLPAADTDDLTRLLLAHLDGVPGSAQSPPSSVAAGRALQSYLQAELAARRRSPQEGLLDAIIAAETAGSLRVDESLGLAFILFVAGIDTTAALIINGLNLLLARREHWAEAVDDPVSADACLEEIVRYASPVQGLARTLTEDVTINDVRLQEGARVWLAFGAANRDPRRFSSPSEFNPGRPQMRNLGFGEGIHHCIGAPLARLEGRLAISRFLSRVATCEATGPPVRLYNHTVRSWAKWPARVT